MGGRVLGSFFWLISAGDALLPCGPRLRRSSESVCAAAESFFGFVASKACKNVSERTPVSRSDRWRGLVELQCEKLVRCRWS
jgi:hypothetical protein